MEAVTLLRNIERRLLPVLQPRLAANRIRHIRSVNNAFAALTDGHFSVLYDALHPDLKVKTDPEKYCWLLSRVRDEYSTMPQKDRNNLAVAVALHDTGYLVSQGLSHNNYSAELVSHFFMTLGLRNVDRQAVTRLVMAHGLYSDLTVNFLPKDLNNYSPGELSQLLLINAVDMIGKVGGSTLSQRSLQIMLDMRAGIYHDAMRYFELRMRVLLGPNNYCYLEDEVAFLTMMDRVRGLSAADQVGLFRNVTGRFRNTCWAVFHEIGIIHKSIRPYFDLLLRLSQLAEEELQDAEDVILVFRPDFFSLSMNERFPYARALDDYQGADFLQAKREGVHGIIEVNLDKLLRLGP